MTTPSFYSCACVLKKSFIKFSELKISQVGNISTGLLLLTFLDLVSVAECIGCFSAIAFSFFAGSTAAFTDGASLSDEEP